MGNNCEMKLDNNNKDTERGTNMNNSNLNQQQQQQQQAFKRDKSIDVKETKEKLKQDKLQKEKEKKEREKLEKERKERDKKEKERIEKEKKEREKYFKKTGQLTSNVPVSATVSDINKLTKQNSKDSYDQSSSHSSANLAAGIPSSKSENVLTKFKKQTSLLSSSSKNNKLNNIATSQQQMQQQQIIPKGRFRCSVIYLDESVKTFDLDKNAIGEDLVTLVCSDLELVEKEYFSLTYRDVNNMKFWLEHDKKIKSQLKGNIGQAEPVFNFEVKFYPPEPNVLQEEITRYLLTLQLRHDIMDGKLPCTFVTYALLGSYTVQAELGDYDDISNMNTRMNINGLGGFEYLDGFCFAPNQTPELLAAIAECHKDHKGQAPAEAEMHFLENAVKLAMYGVDLHNAKDSDGVDILIGVSASGLLVFRDHLRINRFAWPKILKISYKRNHFYLKLRPGEFEKYETTIGFRCPNHKSAKRLWKIAVEHHAFFRLREPETKKSRIIPTLNSKFRYTGSSTYMQSRHRSIERAQPPFTRSLSKRLTQSMDRGLALQNPNETPGSVQSAAFNHFNRMKPHMSISNIPRQNVDLRESHEDLDLDQGADYDVNDDPNLNPNMNYNNYNNQYQQQQQQQQINQQFNNTPKKNQLNQGPSNTNSPLPKLNANFLDRIQRESGNMSNRSSNDSYKQSGQPQQPSSTNNSGIYQSAQKKSTTMPNFNQNQLEPIQQSETNSFDQLEDYYTSVDKNFTNDENRTPSIKRSLADSIASMSGINKVSTPILNPNQQQQQPSQRYVPARQALNQQVPQISDEFDPSNSMQSSRIPISPRSNLNNVNKQGSEPIPFVKTPIYRPPVQPPPSQPNKTTQSPSNSERFVNPQATSSTGSIRSIDKNVPQQPLPPQPTIRGRQPPPQPPPPPVPADRSSLSNRQQQLIDEQEIERQRALIEQQEAELQQQYQLQNQKIQQLREQQLQKLQQQQQPSSSIRQQPGTSSSSSFVPNRPNESSRSGSISSTPEITRVKKQIVVNEQVNHKDLLLKAIQMATELDPNLEVEKVEITTEE